LVQAASRITQDIPAVFIISTSIASGSELAGFATVDRISLSDFGLTGISQTRFSNEALYSFV
jgi:hypothetical protein